MSGVNSIDGHELVSSKENIQPLRRGRDTSILCAALQAENDVGINHELKKQRNEFEIKLRSDNGEDPLSDWCAYIHWIEQSFPRQSREGNLNVVLKKCIKKFKDSEKYINDVRFVRLCIKYADMEDNTVELLSQMHRHGIGASCAELYIAWAEKYAVDNCFKKANVIYEKGLQCQAQPLELLKEAHQNFQAFLVRKMINDGEIFQPTVLDANPSVETRQPYNVLQTVTMGRKEVVPSVRVGQNTLGTVGKLQQISTKDSKPKNNKVFEVYEDGENNFPQPEPKIKLEKVPSKKIMTKENTVKPGPWTNKQSKHMPFTVESTGSFPFQVHKDEDDTECEKKPRSVPSSVLKSHKVKQSYEDENFENAPLFYPEPYDPTKISMYCKEKVYAGGLEFQFEELRAIQFRQKREEILMKRVNALKHSRTDGTAQEGPPEPPPPQKSESHSKMKSDKKTNECTGGRKIANESRRKSLFSIPLPSQGEPPKADCIPPQENLPTTDYSMNQTIHTKEALSEMQQLWFSKPASPVPVVTKPAKPAAKSILKPSKPCFSLYVDESCLENLKTPECQEGPLDLTLKSHSENEVLNPPSGVRKKTGLSNKINPPVENCKENVYVEAELVEGKKSSSESETDDEDKENFIPADYCGPVGQSKRKVSGILTPAENVEIAPLSDEEASLTPDTSNLAANGIRACLGRRVGRRRLASIILGKAEKIQVEDDGEEDVQNDSSIIQCNATEITETWNFTKGFQFPRGESTPNVRKSILKKEDCNESVFGAEQRNEQNMEVEENENRLDEINDKTIVLHSDNKKTGPNEVNNFTKNLSVIAESSREYRSSSSGSSGVTTLQLRPSKNFPYTPSETKTVKLNLTSSQTTIHKTKVQNSGYEASGEFSQSLKTPTTNRLNVTYDLMNKLKAIDSCSMSEKEEAESVAKELSKLQVEEKKEVEDIDPFSDELLEKLLKEVEFPKDNHWNGYFLFDDVDLAAPRVGSTIALGPENFEVKKVLGEGSYARIFKLLKTRNSEFMIGKFQKPAFPWEFYITREVQARIQDKNLLPYFMDVEAAYFFKNCSFLLTRPVEFGDLLSVINKMKQAQMICQNLAIYFTCQILKIVEALHSCKIIHGDIKPDNFLLRNHSNKLQLQLIDFGRSIDMSLFPEGTTFKRTVTTEGFTTIEMRQGRPWSYQIDLYGIANCGHCLLFGDYMKVVEKGGVWNISKIIHRYWARTEWRNFFVSLINVESCSKLPSLCELREAFEVVLEDCSEIECSLNKLKNLLQSK